MKTKFRMLSALVAVAMLVTMLSFGTLSVSAAPDGYTQAGGEVYYKLDGTTLYIAGEDAGSDGVDITGAAATLKEQSASAKEVVIEETITEIGADWFASTVGAIVVKGSASAPALTIAADAFSGIPKLRVLILARDAITWTGLAEEDTVDGLLNADSASDKTGQINIFVADDAVAAAVQALENGELTKTATGMLTASVTKKFATGIYNIAAADVDWKFINNPGKSIGGTVDEQWIDWVYSEGVLYYDINEEWGTSPAMNYATYNVKNPSNALAWPTHLTDITKIVIGEGITRTRSYAAQNQPEVATPESFSISAATGNGGFTYVHYIDYTNRGWTAAEQGKTAYPNLVEVVLPSTFLGVTHQDFMEAHKFAKVNLEDTAATAIGDHAFAGTAVTRIELPETIQIVSVGALKTTLPEGVDKLTVVVNSECPDGFSVDAFTKDSTSTTAEIQVKNPEHKASWETKFEGVPHVDVADYVAPEDPEQPGDGSEDEEDEPVVVDGYTKAGSSEVWYKLAAHDKLANYTGNTLYIKGADGNDEGADINIEGAADALKEAAAAAGAVVIDASITGIGDGWFDGTNVGAVVVEGAEGSSLTINAGSFKNMPKLRELIIARDNITWDGLSTATTVDGLLNPADAAKTGGINIFVADDAVAASLQALDNTATLAKGSATKKFATGIYNIAATDVDWRSINNPGKSTGGSVDEQWVDWVYSDGVLYYDINEECGTRTDVQYGAATVKRADQAPRTWWEHLDSITKIVIGEGPTKFADNAGIVGSWAYVDSYIKGFVHSGTQNGTGWDAEGPVYPNLVEVVLPHTFTSIGLVEFKQSDKLAKINLEDTQVASIGDAAFERTNITRLELPATVTTVGKSALNTVTTASKLTLIVNSTYPGSTFKTNAFDEGNATNTPVEIQARNSEHKQGWIDAFAEVRSSEGESYITVTDYKPLYISDLKVTNDKKASVTYEYADVVGAEAQSYVLIVAAYSGNALVDVDFVDGTMAVGTSGTITTDALDIVEGYTYKAMIWDGFATLKPLKY